MQVPNLKEIIIISKMNTGNFWNKQEELQLMDEISEKKSLDEIAKSHGRTPKAIEMRLEGIIRKQYSDGYTLSSLMNLYNKTEKDVKKIIQDAAIPSQPKEPKKKQSNEEDFKKIEERLERIEKYLIRIYKKIC